MSKVSALQQLELLPVRPKPTPVSHELIVSRSSMLAAIKLAQDVSGLEDKQIYESLQLDKAGWSRVMSGQQNFPTNAHEHFMQLVGNDIPLIWLAYRRGYELKPLLSTTEQKLAAAHLVIEALQRENEIIRKFVRETR